MESANSYSNTGVGCGVTGSDNNGNLLGQTIVAGSATFHQVYTYDALNRVVTAAEANGALGWSQSYGYDTWGNRTINSTLGVSLWAPAAYDPATNHATGSGWAYTGGNVTGTPFAAMAYNADGLMTAHTPFTGTAATYIYDGEGRRVKSVVGGAETTHVYNAMGRLAASYGGAAASTGRRYLTTDQLGTVRLVTGEGATAPVLERHDYAPFGEEIGPAGCDQTSRPFARSPRCNVSGYSGGDVRVRFSGKERDAETGLDYFGAPYMSSAQGRFTSPDPKMFPHDLTDPQSWNKYGYTRNNPLRYTDPDGEDWQDALKGAINAFASDNSFGAGRIDTGNSDFKTGQAIGDAVATVQGTVETLAGIGGEIGGTILDLAGVGALVGVPAQVASAGAIVQGGSTAAIAGSHLANATFATINEQKQAGHEPGTPQNENRTKQGKATSTFTDAKEGRDLTHDTHATGTSDPKFPNQKTKDYGRPVGKGANGGDQTRVRVHEDSKGKIHGHPDGPEQ